ncbi:MAG: tyrosine-type recombinase/integrase, partial [Acidobacteria bacterium]|nr:tyrosine-type recombinase/integrase [Acidobacteriota bacterium]
MAFKKRVRIIKKIRQGPGLWHFVSLDRVKGRYIWDKRPGYYFIEWWEGKKRKRELVGHTPTQALEAQRRKANELIGELVTGNGRPLPQEANEGTATPITDAVQTFLNHVRVHSPEKPNTHRRYEKVLEHAERILGRRKYAEAITRADIDDYKTARSREFSQQHPGRRITPRTINYEISVMRTFFYFLQNERGLPIQNPCARFKALKDPQTKAKRRPPTYTRKELERLFAQCNEQDKTMFATLLLTGLRKEELYFLTWPDADLKNLNNVSIRVTGKDGFSPKDYEERIIPLPRDLAEMLKKLPQTAEWIFPNKNGGRTNHLLRRLKKVAASAKVQIATLHKFRHTYATQLLESGCDIVTVQKLMGHSDIDTTRQYLNPD